MNPRARATYVRHIYRRFMFAAIPMTFRSPADGSTVTIPAIDRTSGQEVQLKNEQYPEIKPLVEVRNIDLQSLALKPSDMVNVEISINEKSWRVMASSIRPTPFGDSLATVSFIVMEVR